ncbi:cytochrome P450 2B19 [Patella vulgata]|uniref:cytochrome P450 2B19 n=1 Tax=Patella vulgata TaxID=6465 RepID=UPI0024A84782|nr:cytochrome P450 2B19 [Patella vulgata]
MAGIITKLQSSIGDYTLEDFKQFCKDNVNVRSGLVFGVCIGIWWLMRKPRGIPPGPKFTLPLIGDLLFLGKGDINVILRRMRKKYGDIFSMYFGPRLVIVLNGYDKIKEALVKNGDLFSDRPTLFVSEMIGKRRGIVSSSGQLWKDQRKFALETLREFGFGRTILEDKIHEEIEVFIEVIRKHNGRQFDMFRSTQSAISNIISSLVYGQRFEYDDPLFNEFLERVEENFNNLGNTGLINFLPVIRFLPGDFFKFKRTLANVAFAEDDIIRPSIAEHKRNFDPHHTDDYIGSYIKAMKRAEETGEQSNLDENNLIKSIGDLFVAGTETTSTTILWTILYLLHNPNIQARCYKEIQDVVGSGRLPSMKDKPSMPYNEAVLLEVLRKANIAVNGVPHTVSEDTIFHGYVIPKDAIILPNLDSVLSDDKIWGDAGVFRPERFIDSLGKVKKQEEFIPFSIGRRVCLGESLAKMELFLFMTTLIQRFEFKPVEPDNLPTLKGVFGITHAPTKYDVRAVPRC